MIFPEPEAKGGRMVGTMPFDSGSLYSGGVQFVVTVDTNFDLVVTEFKLPNFDITLVRNENGIWERDGVRE